MSLTFLFKYVAYQQFESNLQAQNKTYLEIETRPTPLNSILWTANIETPQSYLIGFYSLFDSNKSIHFTEFYKNHLLLGPMAKEEKVKTLIKLSKGWYTIEQKEDKIIFNDLRFGQLGMSNPTAPFVFSFILSYNQKGEFIVEETPKSFDHAAEAFSELFTRIKGI